MKNKKSLQKLYVAFEVTNNLMGGRASDLKIARKKISEASALALLACHLIKPVFISTRERVILKRLLEHYPSMKINWSINQIKKLGAGSQLLIICNPEKRSRYFIFYTIK